MRRFSTVGVVVSLAALLAADAGAQVSAYEWVTQGSRNNVIDSNTASCDNSPFNAATGLWAAPGQGCYDRSGAPCSADPSHKCDLQIVPEGRCTSGSLLATGGPGGTNTCVWPHGAGRCSANPRVGCVTDAYLANPANTSSGASSMCAGTGSSTCDMSVDPYGGPFRTDCVCDGENAAAANFETVVCGTLGGARPLCSDGDPDRDRGGYGFALGFELNLGALNVTFTGLGPAVNGSNVPSTSPRYLIENPPSDFEPQRAAGTVNRAPAPLSAVRPIRTTEARESTALSPSLGVYKLRAFGNSHWADMEFQSQPVTGIFNTHMELLTCDPPVGWQTDQKIDPTPGAPASGDEFYCHQMARDSLAIAWSRDLTAGELAANPTCPPNCKKDFDLTTTELEAVDAVATLDRGAASQLAIQSGEGRQAGAGDVLSATPLTLIEWLNTNDGRCRLGGWGSPSGFIGRCSDGFSACIPGDATNGDSLCSAQGGSCRACNGPIDPANADVTNGQANNLGLPPGYDTHAQAALDLVAGQRLGFIAGVSALVRVPLYLVGTTGYAAADFRDTPGTAGSLDIADLGAVDPNGPTFAVGIGTGGTFALGTLPIGETCCAGGAPIAWAPANVGAPVTSFTRTFDAGPGPDGIPGCMGDTPLATNGLNACNQRLGSGNVGPKTDGFFATGRDDVAQTLPVGSSGVIPASSSRFGADGAAVLGGTPAFNLVTALAFRDRSVFGSSNLDGLVKLDVSHCPIVGGSHDCGVVAPPDSDLDGVPDAVDNCPTVANADQSDLPDADGVGDACDSCVTHANPRMPASFLASAAGSWATLTGGQRDDDHDGYGNRCDAKFVGSGLIGAGDLAQLRASLNKSRSSDTCGTSGLRPCAIFDLDEDGFVIGAPDMRTFRSLRDNFAGPKCPTCPLACSAGVRGTCGPVPP